MLIFIPEFCLNSTVNFLLISFCSDLSIHCIAEKQKQYQKEVSFFNNHISVICYTKMQLITMLYNIVICVFSKKIE